MKNINNNRAGSKHDIVPYRFLDYMLRMGLRVLPVSDWSERVALWWGFRYQPAPCVVMLRSGALIQVDPTDYLQLLIYYLGTFEPHCLSLMKSCVSKGATVIDVGANIGIYTLESSFAIGQMGRVISIEPAPLNVQALKKSIELNCMTNVTLIEVAVGDSTGSATLSLAQGGNLGMFSLAQQKSDKSYDVEVRCLDDLLEENDIAVVDFIKMDIEGSEYRALCGAVRILRRCQPPVLVELNEKALRSCHSSSQEVKELLCNLGYRGWVIGRKACRPIESPHSVHNCDECLFIHQQHYSLMQKLGLPN
jgi:FkbM family methyltransferase